MKKRVAVVLAIGTIISTTLLLTAPTVPAWSTPLAPDQDTRTLRLRHGEWIAQTVTAEYDRLDTVVVWLDPASTMPAPAELLATINAGEATVQTLATVVTDDGLAIFNVAQALVVNPTTPVRFQVTNKQSQPIYLTYHYDDTKYPGGTMQYGPNERKLGDLAFQLRYQRSALGSPKLQRAAAIALLMTGLLIAISIWKVSDVVGPVMRRDYWVSGGLFVIMSCFYAGLLIRPGIWLGPNDFAKDVSYTAASAAALTAGRFPAISPLTCGGMALVGNPEGNTLSLATLLALLTDPEHALWWLLALEAGAAAAGSYFLARNLFLAPGPSLIAALISGLSPAYAYKLVEGFSMLGGIYAFAPWIFVAYLRATRGQLISWGLLGGLFTAAAFWRGDVHVVVGLAAALLTWAAVATMRDRSLRPFISLVLIGAVALFVSSVKIIAYLEQPDLINPHVQPNVALLSKQGLWDDVLLKLHPASMHISVQHGEPEHYGYVGMYIGLLPLTLASIGLVASSQYRLFLLSAMTMLVVLIDGVLYEHFLRHYPPLSALLRMPSRLSLALLPLLAVAAALGLTTLSKHLRSRLLVLIIGLFITIDLGRATASIINDSRALRTNDLPAPPVQPTLAVHQNDAGQARHASQLLAAGYLLPHICGDQNNPPKFLSTLTDITPLSSATVSLSPNRIHLTAPTPSTRLNLRFISSYSASAGFVLPNQDGSLQVVVPSPIPSAITLTYLSPTAHVQKTLLLTLVASVVCFFIPLKQAPTSFRAHP